MMVVRQIIVNKDNRQNSYSKYSSRLCIWRILDLLIPPTNRLVTLVQTKWALFTGQCLEDGKSAWKRYCRMVTAQMHRCAWSLDSVPLWPQLSKVVSIFVTFCLYLIPKWLFFIVKLDVSFSTKLLIYKRPASGYVVQSSRCEVDNTRLFTFFFLKLHYTFSITMLGNTLNILI